MYNCITYVAHNIKAMMTCLNLLFIFHYMKIHIYYIIYDILRSLADLT